MKKLVSIVTLALVLVVHPVLASKPSDNGNGNGKQNHENYGSVQSALVRQDNNLEDTQPKNDDTDNTSQPEHPSITPSPTKPQIQTGSSALSTTTTDAACDPNAEWKNHGEYVSCVAHTHPGGQVVSDAAHSDVGKNKNITPTIPPTETPTPSPITSPLSTVASGLSPLASLGALIGKVFGFLKHLL